jgi:hypothetical protein
MLKYIIIPLFIVGLIIIDPMAKADAPPILSTLESFDDLLGWSPWSEQAQPKSPVIHTLPDAPPFGKVAVLIEFPQSPAVQVIGKEYAALPSDAVAISFWAKYTYGTAPLQVILRDQNDHNYEYILDQMDSDWKKYTLPLSDFKSQTPADSSSLNGTTMKRLMFGMFRNEPVGIAIGPIEVLGKQN